MALNYARYRVRSHVCAWASSRHPLAGLPLPSASSYAHPHRGLHRYSYRGLAPHQFMHMLGVHKAIKYAPFGRRTLAPFMAGVICSSDCSNIFRNWFL